MQIHFINWFPFIHVCSHFQKMLQISEAGLPWQNLRWLCPISISIYLFSNIILYNRFYYFAWNWHQALWSVVCWITPGAHFKAWYYVNPLQSLGITDNFKITNSRTVISFLSFQYSKAYTIQSRWFANLSLSNWPIASSSFTEICFSSSKLSLLNIISDMGSLFTSSLVNTKAMNSCENIF